MSSVFLPLAPKYAAELTAIAVLPTPPFKLTHEIATGMIQSVCSATYQVKPFAQCKLAEMAKSRGPVTGLDFSALVRH